MQSRPFVLIVEDDDDIREDLAYLLARGGGCRIETAANGREALDLVARLGPPCLILLDLMMPVMDGWQLRAHLLADDELRDVPVAVISGVSQLEREVRSLQAVGHLSKPIKLPDLERLVGEHC